MILHELLGVEEGVVGICWFFLVSFIMVDKRETMGERGNSVFFWVFVGRWLHLRLFECLGFFFIFYWCYVRMEKIRVNIYFL